MRPEQDKRDFVTFALDDVKHSTVHKRRGGGGGDERGEEPLPLPQESGPPEISIPQERKSPRYCCEEVRHMATQWINGEFTMAGCFRKEIGGVPRPLLWWWKRSVATTQILREHFQEADQLANLGATEVGKIAMDERISDGQIGCGIVIKGVDKDRWFTVRATT